MCSRIKILHTVKIYIICLEIRLKMLKKKFETYDYGWLMVHDEDMIIYMRENFSFKMFSFIGHGYDFSLPSKTNVYLFMK